MFQTLPVANAQLPSSAPCRPEEDKDAKRKQVRPLFRHFRRIDACLQPREAFRGSDESESHATDRDRGDANKSHCGVFAPVAQLVPLHWESGAIAGIHYLCSLKQGYPMLS